MIMKHFLRSTFILLLLLSATAISWSQPFKKEIDAFKHADSVSFPPKNAILFVGSSSFTRWTNLKESFPNHTVINRGFGGSSLTHLIIYVDSIVIPYHPKQVVIYCGENDLAANDSVTATMVFDRFKTFFGLVRKQLKNVPIVFVSIKPSPSRQLIQPKVIEANALIKAFLAKQKQTNYVDVYKDMIDDEGKPIASLFVEDNLHMNAKGYAIWIKAIEPYLLK